MRPTCQEKRQYGDFSRPCSHWTGVCYCSSRLDIGIRRRLAREGPLESCLISCRPSMSFMSRHDPNRLVIPEQPRRGPAMQHLNRADDGPNKHEPPGEPLYNRSGQSRKKLRYGPVTRGPVQQSNQLNQVRPLISRFLSIHSQTCLFAVVIPRLCWESRLEHKTQDEASIEYLL